MIPNLNVFYGIKIRSLEIHTSLNFSFAKFVQFFFRLCQASISKNLDIAWPLKLLWFYYKFDSAETQTVQVIHPKRDVRVTQRLGKVKIKLLMSGKKNWNEISSSNEIMSVYPQNCMNISFEVSFERLLPFTTLSISD